MKETRPVSVTVERRVKRGAVPAMVPAFAELQRQHGLCEDRAGWWARIVLNTGAIVEVSRMDGEPERQWLVDATYSASGLPFEVHGFGSRATRKAQITPVLTDAVMRAVDDATPAEPGELAWRVTIDAKDGTEPAAADYADRELAESMFDAWCELAGEVRLIRKSTGTTIRRRFAPAPTVEV